MSYAIIVRADKPSDMTTADVVEIDEAQFLAVTAIIHRQQQQHRRVRVTWYQGINVRDQPKPTALIVGAVAVESEHDVLDVEVNATGEWVRIGSNRWFARTYYGSEKAKWI